MGTSRAPEASLHPDTRHGVSHVVWQGMAQDQWHSYVCGTVKGTRAGGWPTTEGQCLGA